jgi:hypothetical protein
MVWRWLTVIVVRKGLDMVWYIEGCVSMGNLDVFATDKALGDYRVCMIDCDNEALSDGDIVANARLIAAAPDLLAALEDMLNLTLDEDDIAVSSRIAKARAVIAKAKGEA